MNVMQQELIGEPRRDRVETLDDEVQIVEHTPISGPAVRAQMRFNGEATGERTAEKAICEKLVDDLRGPMGIGGTEEGGEHGQ
jgi:hypothetical protein